MIICHNKSLDPAFNLALEEVLMKEHKGSEIFMLWKNSRSVICGRNQNVYEQIDVIEAEKAGVPVYKRFSGGGTVFHDGGNINYSYISDFGKEEEFDAVSFAAEILSKAGIPAETGEKGDILLCGKKISGCAKAVSGGRMLTHGTLLYDADLGMLKSLTSDRCLPSLGEGKAIQSRNAEVANIKSTCRRNESTDEFLSLLLNIVSCGGEISEIEEGDRKKAKALAEEKYSSWDNIFGTTPKFSFEKGDIKYESYHGVITKVSGTLPASLCGTKLLLRDITEALAKEGFSPSDADKTAKTILLSR